VSESERIPIVRLRQCLLASIQVDLSDALVAALKDDIAATVLRTGATGLVIDVSGVELMDSYIARAVRDIGLMVALMGVRSAICGISPGIALTLVEMGMDLKGVRCELDLDSAVAWLEGRSSR
jgi:rsbT antagonist protein RsbS